MKLEILEYTPIARSNVPPLLFVHGAGHGAWCWKEYFLPYFLSKGFSCYALSLRGHGESEGIEKLNSFSLRDYIDDVLEVIEYVKEKPVLIGHSMGGAIVQKIAHAHPDKIAALILLASVPPQGMMKDFWRLLFAHFREMFQVTFSHQRKRVDFLAQFFFSNNLTVEESDEFTKRLQLESRIALREACKRIVPTSTRSLWPGFRRASVAVPQVPLLIIGSKKDAIFPEKTVKSMGKAYKTEPIIFSDICHDMMLDPKWQGAADAIYAFLCKTVSADEKDLIKDGS